MVFNGQISSIFLQLGSGEPVGEVDPVQEVPGKRLEGDCCFAGMASKGTEPAREITSIGIESLRALETKNINSLRPAESRRNLIPEKTPLSHLVGREFRVRNVSLAGIRLCEHCAHLANLSQEKVLCVLVRCGGLRAQSLTDGIIPVGDILSEIDNISDEEVAHAKPDL